MIYHDEAWKKWLPKLWWAESREIRKDPGCSSANTRTYLTMSNVGHEKPMSKCNKTKNMLYYVIKKSCSDNHHELWCNAHGQWHKKKNVRKKEYKLAQTKAKEV